MYIPVFDHNQVQISQQISLVFANLLPHKLLEELERKRLTDGFDTNN